MVNAYLHVGLFYVSNEILARFRLTLGTIENMSTLGTIKHTLRTVSKEAQMLRCRSWDILLLQQTALLKGQHNGNVTRHKMNTWH